MLNMLAGIESKVSSSVEHAHLSSDGGGLSQLELVSWFRQLKDKQQWHALI